jgi:hypothetical protein
MTTKEFKELIDGCIFDVQEGDCYLGMVKVDGQVSVSFEGKPETLKAVLFSLMNKYEDLAEVVCDAAFVYNEQEDL